MKKKLLWCLYVLLCVTAIGLAMKAGNKNIHCDVCGHAHYSRL